MNYVVKFLQFNNS